MTLKEKYYKELDWNLSGTCERKIKVSEELVKIADDYAIEFAEWVIDTDNKQVGEFTIKELLKIFKKEIRYGR